jgi:hypothetical protein
MPLVDLARHYHLDKEASSGFHDYIPVYHHLFESLQESTKTVFEIGIGCVEKNQMLNVNRQGYKTGNSLRMWRDYFKNANIYSIDIHEEAMIIDEERIKTFVADQSSKEQLEEVCKKIGQPLDIVVDDGSHQYNHQVASFIYLEPFLAPKAIYCIEDINVANIPKFASLADFPEEVKNRLLNDYNIFISERRRPPYFWEDDFIMVFMKKQ